MPHSVDRCPWCESILSRSRYLGIEAMTRKQGKAKLADVEKQLQTEVQAQYAVDITHQVEPELQIKIEDLVAGSLKYIADQRMNFHTYRDQAIQKAPSPFNSERAAYR